MRLSKQTLAVTINITSQIFNLYTKKLAMESLGRYQEFLGNSDFCSDFNEDLPFYVSLKTKEFMFLGGYFLYERNDESISPVQESNLHKSQLVL